MSIERGTIQVVVSARVSKSYQPRLLLAKIFAVLAAKLTSGKVKWEIKES